MRGWVQDRIRWWIGISLVFFGRLQARKIRRTIHQYRFNQARLAERYGLTSERPILSHGPLLQAEIDAFAEQSTESVRFAETSGSTGVPKRIAYTRVRLKEVVGVYIDAFARAYAAMRVKRKSLYVLSSLQKDSSLTTLMMEESSALPPYFSALQAPYRVQSHPEIQALSREFGSHAVRTWVIAISNPGVLYCTNPSTLSTYLDALEEDWAQVSALVRRWVEEPDSFLPVVHRIARRIDAVGAKARLRDIAGASSNIGLLRIAPGIEQYCCWDGGYVRPFLERVRAYLPPDRVRHLPMYSMSTEVIETRPVFEGSDVAFLPLAKNVRYEFLPLDAPSEPDALLEAWELQPGQEALMVVSDAYGLRRYQTEDVFRCERLKYGLCDLRFVRRSGLSWSFTGEKLTGQQIEAVLGILREEFAALSGLDWIALAPFHREGAATPGYVLLLVGSTDRPPSGIATRFDALLGTYNSEFEDKLASHRLAPTEVRIVPLLEYIERVGGQRHSESWESQFKFLPLVRKEWEES